MTSVPRYYIKMCKVCKTPIGDNEESALVAVELGPGKKLVVVAHKECAASTGDDASNG